MGERAWHNAGLAHDGSLPLARAVSVCTHNIAHLTHHTLLMSGFRPEQEQLSEEERLLWTFFHFSGCPHSRPFAA